MSVEWPTFTGSAADDIDEKLQPDDIYDADTETLKDFSEDLRILIERELRERDEAEKLRNQIMKRHVPNYNGFEAHAHSGNFYSRLSGLPSDNGRVASISSAEQRNDLELAHPFAREAEQPKSPPEILRFELTDVQHSKHFAGKSLSEWQPQRVTDMPFVVGSSSGRKKNKMKRGKKPNTRKGVRSDKAKESPARQKLRKMKEYSTLLKTRLSDQRPARPRLDTSADVPTNSNCGISIKLDHELEREHSSEESGAAPETTADNKPSEVGKRSSEGREISVTPSEGSLDGYTDDEFDESSISDASATSENGCYPARSEHEEMDEETGSSDIKDKDEERATRFDHAEPMANYGSCEDRPDLFDLGTANSSEDPSDERTKVDIDSGDREQGDYEGFVVDNIGGILADDGATEKYLHRGNMNGSAGETCNETTNTSALMDNTENEEGVEDTIEGGMDDTDAAAVHGRRIDRDADTGAIERETDKSFHTAKVKPNQKVAAKLRGMIT
ncbi:hypothetical protein FOL47_009698 [Perkinsus chesapeaki]|uniref:Uncharacterized protein n=1 Tax=Perkinsus chesapeaki TaxID=330153 RepID=A0A7J6L6S7_PERCH|nr:hypothetical protein FOL47_009698 [Perkinsus chesapeaki]